MNLMNKLADGSLQIAVIGLGYVGLPLAVAFGNKFRTVGFDVKQQRIAELASGRDHTEECSPEELLGAARVAFCCDPEALKSCDVFIVTVPTPVDVYNRPDLTPLIAASQTVGRVMRPGAVVVYESTVYPGCTEEECVPVIEKMSQLKFNEDFFAGYSPERINPGDREHKLASIRKVTSGSTEETAQFVDALYGSIITAGTFRAASIKVAEAAKVIENTQRDLNVAFVNELAKIFHKIGIDTSDVLEAAGTKWNFLPFRPGLVGGHCIGVDPYYLTHKAQALGYHPEIILAGRRMNDGMGAYVAGEVVKLIIKRERRIAGAEVLVLGVTFKENCPDIRNSKAIDVIRELESFGCRVHVADPMADPDEVRQAYGIELTEDFTRHYDAVVLTVAHQGFKKLDYAALRKGGAVIYDVKSVLDRSVVDGRL